MNKTYVISESRLKELLKAEVIYIALEGGGVLVEEFNKECIDNYVEFVQETHSIDECVENKLKEFDV